MPKIRIRQINPPAKFPSLFEALGRMIFAFSFFEDKVFDLYCRILRLSRENAAIVFPEPKLSNILNQLVPLAKNSKWSSNHIERLEDIKTQAGIIGTMRNELAHDFNIPDMDETMLASSKRKKFQHQWALKTSRFYDITDLISACTDLWVMSGEIMEMTFHRAEPLYASPRKLGTWQYKLPQRRNPPKRRSRPHKIEQTPK